MLNQLVLTLGCAALMVSSWAVAQDAEAGPNTGEKGEAESAQATAVELLAMADSLAALGRKNESPFLLIAAAELVARVGPGIEVDCEKESEGGAAMADASDKPESEPAEMSVASLLAEARELAGGDESLEAVIDRVEETSQGAMGRLDGPLYHWGAVAGSQTNLYRDIYFEGGRCAIVSVTGEGDNDLDLYIYDGNGNMVASGTGPTDRETASWTPHHTGPFTIRVVSLGVVRNRYLLRSN